MPTNTNNTLLLARTGRQLRQTREKQNLDIAQLSDDIGISPLRLTGIEQGDIDPTLTELKAICDRLFVTLNSMAGA